MNNSLSNMLGGRMMTGIDSDANAYIQAIVLAGATVTSVQRGAINNFVKAEKTALRWDTHKRFYLPIWANASANAICMKSLAVGTFVNSPTMGAGFIKGNSTTQYFNINTTLGALGLTDSSGSYVIGLKAESSINIRANAGALDAGGYFVDFRLDSAGGRRLTWLLADSVAGTFDTAQKTGVIVTSRTSSSQYNVYNDTSTLGSVVYTGGVPTVNPFVMARNSSGAATLYGDSEIAFVGFGLGLSAPNAQAYAVATKNLWQTCTGLTLP
jgi:hypothetical protein